jgi:hypothetical protein
MVWIWFVFLYVFFDSWLFIWRLISTPPRTANLWIHLVLKLAKSYTKRSIYGAWVGDGARWYFELVCGVPWPLDNFWNLFWPVIIIPPPILIEFLLVTNGKAFCFSYETTFREIGNWTCWFWLWAFWVWVLCVPLFVEYIFNPFEADRRLWIWMMFLGTDGCRWLRSNGKYSIY